MLPFRRPGGKVEVDPEVLRFAQLAYAFVREVDHPVPDSTMVHVTRDHLVLACSELSFENRQMLSR